MERRKFIIGAVAGGIGLLQYAIVTRYMNRLRAPRGFSVKEFTRYDEQAALMAITPTEDFFVLSKGDVPKIGAADWRLRIDGLVAHPLTLTYRELLELPRVEKVLTLECISNPIGGHCIGNARWTGTLLQPLLERVQPLKEAAHAILYGADGYSTGHPIARLWKEENFLAYQMNEEDLAPAHGYPVRIFIPGKFGQKQPKWLTRVQFVNEAYLGYWESKGWSDSAECGAHARFTDLEDGAEITGESFELTGYAVGNLDGISAVEISFDGGKTWTEANLFSNPAPLTWSFWKYVWIKPQAGTYRIRVRAIDNRGRVQGWEPRDPFPNGATGQQVMKVKVL